MQRWGSIDLPLLNETSLGDIHDSVVSLMIRRDESLFDSQDFRGSLEVNHALEFLSRVNPQFRTLQIALRDRMSLQWLCQVTSTLDLAKYQSEATMGEGLLRKYL